MRLMLTRRPAAGGATLGALTADGAHEAWTLEPAAPVPAGIYEVVLTPSQRAASGQLWSPREDHALPLLLGVPGHTGIRIHAGNTARDTSGCILVGRGQESDPPTLFQSREALTALIEAMVAAMAAGGTSIEIV
jgi:hypothetical protein